MIIVYDPCFQPPGDDSTATDYNRLVAGEKGGRHRGFRARQLCERGGAQGCAETHQTAG